MSDASFPRIGDLVELPRVRTVIQLSDVDDPKLPASLLENFILTAESDVALSTFLESMAGEQGEGFFLQGNFGSGKSHLLALLDLPVRSDSAWEARQEVEALRLLPGFLPLVGPEGEWIERLNLVDDKVHESTADLVGLLTEIELHARRILAVLLEEAPRGSLVLLFSDHGFREDPHWTPSARHRRQRYRHGGASPWEVITPLAVLFRT